MWRYYRPKNRHDDEDRALTEVEEVFLNQVTFEMFYEFAKKEFSIENVLYKVDSDEFKLIKSSTKRLKHAQQMVIKYLSGQDSPLEINADMTTIKPILESISSKSVPIDLFRKLDYIVLRNLNDTYSRFMFSREYKRYRRMSINTLEAIAEKKNSGIDVTDKMGTMSTIQ